MPDWKRVVRENLPGGRFRGGMAAEIQEEIAAHLEDTYVDALRMGATEEQAEAHAGAQIDDWEALAERIAASRGGSAESWTAQELDASELALRRRGGQWTRVADLLQETRLTLRRLRRAPVFTLVVLLSLGVGIGANTAIYSVVKAVLLDPLPYSDADRLVAVWNTAPGSGEDLIPQSLAVNAVYEDEARAFEHVGVWRPTTAAVTDGDAPMEVPSLQVTHGLFPALGVEPILGRSFTFEDTQTGSPLTVVLAHKYWVGRFGADPDIVGKTLELWETPWEIIGVMPPGFRVLDRDPDLYRPLRYDKASLTVSSFVHRSIGRLNEGVSIDRALTDLDRLLPLATERYPGAMTLDMLRQIGGAPILHPLKDELVGNVGNVLWVVMGGVGIILLVACANVANLLLVQSDGHQRALAVQSALGSSGRRLLMRFFSESVTLGVLGGAVGMALAYGALRILRSAGPADLPRLHEIDLDPGVVLFTFLVSVLAGAALGVLPLARAWRLDLSRALKEGGWGAGGAGGRRSVGNALAVAQLAMAMILLVGSGLMIRTFISLNSVRPGFTEPERILTFTATATGAVVPEDADVTHAHEALARRLEDLPAVTSVGLTTSVPMDGRGGFDPIYVEDFPLPEGQQAPIKRFKWIGGGYHEAVGNPVVAGRAITWRDVHDMARVVMITESFAREVWGEPARAVGRRIATGYGPGDWREIVGVVGDVRDDGLDQDPVDVVYWPMAIRGFWAELNGPQAVFLQRSMTYVVRSSRVGTPGFLGDIRDAVWASFPGRPLGMVRTMADLQRESLARTSFTMVILAVAAAMALLLGSIGIFGVVSYAVGRRTREMGLRIAMGARPRRVMRMVLGQGLLMATAGLAFGIGGAVVATRLMDAILFGVSPVDPLTYGAVGAVLLATAMLATWVPARRAARVDPVEALRAE
jgi:putative ABC transport system permease protein